MTLIEKLKKLCRTSLFISLLMTWINEGYNYLRDGFFGRIMTSYSVEEKLFRKGVIGQLFSKRGKVATWVWKIRLRLAEFFEKSALLELGLKKTTYLLGCSLRVYGIFLLTSGSYTVLIHYIKRYAFPEVTQTRMALWIGAIAIALAVPMIGSRNSLAELLQKGLLPRLLLIDIFGISEERFDIPRVKGGGRYNYALLLGMLIGVLTLAIPVQYMVLFALGLVVVAIVLSYPEVGVLALIAMIPFSAGIGAAFHVMDFAIGLTAIAYLGKLIRGKRIIRFSLIDTLVLAFGVVLLFSGVASAGGEVSLQQARHTCLLILMYFMIVNLIRTPAWLHRAVLAGVGSACLFAMIGVFQYVGGRTGSLSETGLFSSVLTRISSTFESPGMYAAYLMLLMPLLLAIWVTTTGIKHRLIAALCGLAMAMSMLFTWSRSAWIGVSVALLVFLLIYSRKSACWLLLGGTTIPIWWSILPQSVVDRLIGMTDMSDPAIYERIYTWKGTLRMIGDHLLGGVGYGPEAFQQVYPEYSYTGLEQAGRVDNMYLSLLCAVGLLGLVVFLLMVVVFAQHCFEYIGNAPESYSKTFVAAGLASIVGTLVMGFGCDIWYDETVLLTFFTVLALTCAYIRAGVLIRMRNQDVSGTDVSHAHVDLHFET